MDLAMYIVYCSPAVRMPPQKVLFVFMMSFTFYAVKGLSGMHRLSECSPWVLPGSCNAGHAVTGNGCG